MPSKSQQRILITRDRDFKSNWTTLKDHPGVILISPGSQTSEEVNKVCQKTFKKLSPNFISESLCRVTSDKIIRNKNGQITNITMSTRYALIRNA